MINLTLHQPKEEVEPGQEREMFHLHEHAPEWVVKMLIQDLDELHGYKKVLRDYFK